MLHGIAGFCQTAAQQTTPSSNSDNARKKNAAETFATACGVIGALQPVYLCKAAQPLLLQLLKVRPLLKVQCIVPRVLQRHHPRLRSLCRLARLIASALRRGQPR